MSSFVMKSVARVVPNVQGSFNHSFGGPAVHRGSKPRGNSQPLHLVYTLDTKDPSVPVHIPRVRYLPLYYCFPYNAGALGYRVVSDGEITILYMETKRVQPDFPYEGYPSEFVKTPVSLAPISYEDHKTLVYYMTCEDHNLQRKYLSKKDKASLTQIGYPFTQLGGIQRMWQGIPDVPCPNRTCEYHRYNCFMQVFAVVWNHPVPRVYLWDDDPKTSTEIQVIFQICPLCDSIYVCSRGT
ncbi:MAG TPA: hypothetical protein VN843_25320 [Anaerolineales bacterium]|nr:hypothetical protein [Anaerolineales bacterium]